MTSSTEVCFFLFSGGKKTQHTNTQEHTHSHGDSNSDQTSLVFHFFAFECGQSIDAAQKLPAKVAEKCAAVSNRKNHTERVLWRRQLVHFLSLALESRRGSPKLQPC